MKNIISLLLFIIPLSVFCQPKAKPEIRNINCVNDGKYAILFYDLENTAKNDKYFVEIKITHANGTVIKTRTLSGDAGVVYGGLQRKAFWNYKADSVGLKDDIFVNVKATPVPEIPLAPHLLKSLIYPGWGSQKLSNNKKSLALGGLSYACLASGIILNIASAANYEAYKSSTDFSKVDALYKRSLLQKNLFFALTGVASAIWVYDLFNVFHKRALLLKRKVPVDNNYYYKNVEKQSLSAVSKPLFLNTFDVVKPPKPELIEASVKFEDEDGNKCLNYKESARLIFAVKNAGEGPAINLVAEISSPDIVRGIVFPSKIALGTIPPNKQDTFEIPLTGNEDIGTGEVTLDVKVKEANFNDMKPFSIKFHSLAFTPPSIILADYKFVMENAGKALPGKEIILKVKIQNVGHGSAKNLKAVFIVPPLVNENDRPDYDKEELKPNETWEITFPFTPKYSYTDSILHIVLKLSESYGQYAKAENNLILEMNKDIPPDNIKVGTKPPEPVIDTASYTSDVDKDIPVLQTKNANRFALIIGNEDYSSYQKGIDKESDVEFAIQDARIFKTYCSNVMGIPDRNITLLINATTGTFNHEIEILSRIINTTNGQAEVFFYYAGHGFPDESTGEAYLVPVDVTGSNIKNGIRLNDLYSKLAEYPSQRITVFLDACFSGGGRNKSLEASRAVRINPKDAELKGNMVVFTSSSGNETSAPYNEKNHGIFTYFLLKKIKETNGDISYKDLYDYLSKTIKQESLLINKKEQNPSILHSPSVDKNWGLWNLKP